MGDPIARKSKQPIFLVTDGGELRVKNALVGAISEALSGAKGLIGHVLVREQVLGLPEPAAGDEELVQILRSLRLLCDAHQAKLLIHGRTDLARREKLDGVHLSKHCLSPEEARKIIGPEMLLGYSAHSVEEALSVIKPINQCDYVFLSPIYTPISKPGTNLELGLKSLEDLCEKTEGQVFALGGISADNFAPCMTSGASGVAVIGSILKSKDPKSAASKFADKMARL